MWSASSTFFICLLFYFFVFLCYNIGIMKTFNLKTPVGLKDYILKDMEKKNKIESALKELFLSSGYNLIETPTLEYIDVFTENVQDPTLYKLTNKEGEVLALKNDITKSIARVVRTFTRDFIFPQRFCYISNIFRCKKAYQGMQHEFTQAGIELIGVNDVFADYEVISLAVKSLNATLDNFNLYISSSEFFSNYLDDLNIKGNVKIEILQAIKNKNISNVKKIIENNFSSNKNEYEVLSLVIEAIGKKDLLNRIKGNVKSEKTLASLTRLEKIYDLLEKNGLEKNVSFDFSILSFGDYYTGITLQGYTKGVGSPILEGGRYDNLIGDTDEKVSACGFAINVNDLINKTKLTYEKDIKLIYSNDKEKALKFSNENSFVSLDKCIDDAFAYGLANNIKEIIDIDANKKYELKDGEYICQE